MLTRVEGGTTYTQGWDAENRLTTVTVNTLAGTGGQTTTFYYDGDGVRVKKVQNGQTTVYIGALYEKNVSTGVVTTYYFAGSTRIATRVGGVLYYLHGDHLGSTSLTTDNSGNRVGELKYYPFGETRYTWGSTPTDRRFTGQQEESALGSLYEFNARYYSPAIGRFLSADTIVPEAGNPQAFNRYAYTYNNPVRYIDPSGHFTEQQIMDWSNFRTSEDLRKLHAENPDIYFMLLQLHFGDYVYTQEGFIGRVGLNNGTLLIGRYSVLGLIDLKNSAAAPGFEVRRLMPGHKTGFNIPLVYRTGSFCGGCTGEIRELDTPGYRAESRGWIPTVTTESDEVVRYDSVADAVVSLGVTLVTRVVGGVICSAVSGGGCAAPSAVNIGTALVSGGFNIGRAAVRSLDGLQNGDRTLEYKYSGGWTERTIIRDGQILRYDMNTSGVSR